MRLPEDIVRLVVDQALTVGALNTAPWCTHPASRMAIAMALESLKATKLALLLVSHMVYRLCARRIDEGISVHDPGRLPSLVAYLRRSFLDHFHGFYCRRLDIDIWVEQSSMWLHGATTLWGLIIACPQLEILNVNVISRSRNQETCLCPLSLLIQIADAYGQRLRRLELRGLISVHFSGVRYLSAKCPRLEVLCVPGMFAVRDTYESDDLADELNSLVGRIILPKKSVSQALPLMTAEERDSFASAQARAREWRTLLPATTVRFPCLHTLEIGNYIDFTRRWDMPLVTTLHSSFVADAESWEHIGAVQSAALARLGPGLRSWTIIETDDFDPLTLLEQLPNLRYVAFVVPSIHCLDPNRRGRFAHKNLRYIDLAIDAPYAPLWRWTTYFLELVQARALPALERIRIVARFPYDRWTQEFNENRVALAKAGIRLQFALGNLTNVQTVFHVPALLQSAPEIPGDLQATNRFLALCSQHYPGLLRSLTGKAQLNYYSELPPSAYLQ